MEKDNRERKNVFEENYIGENIEIKIRDTSKQAIMKNIEVNPIKKIHPLEEIVWGLLEKIQFLPTYHAKSLEDMSFELGKIYQEYSNKIRAWEKEALRMDEANDFSKLKMQEDIKEESKPNQAEINLDDLRKKLEAEKYKDFSSLRNRVKEMKRNQENEF